MKKITLNEINRMDGFDFEDLISKLILSMGYHVEQTKKSGDGGIDIIAISREPIISGKYLIQCKRYSKPIGEPVLRDLFGVVNAENANKGIIISNSTYSPKAIDFANNKQLELIDGYKLEKLINEFLNDEVDTKKSLTLSQEKILIKLDKTISKFENRYKGYKDELIYQKKVSKTQKKILWYSDFKIWIETQTIELAEINKILQNNIVSFTVILIDDSNNKIDEINSLLNNIGKLLNELLKLYKNTMDQLIEEDFHDYRNLLIKSLDTIFSGIINIREEISESINKSILSDKFYSGDINIFIDGNKLDIIGYDVEKEKEKLEYKNRPILIKLLDKLMEKSK